MSESEKYIWLDCDPGHDDAMAIILAGHTPGVHLIGISTVAGNQTVDLVTQNALDVLDASGLSHVDVVAGQARPLVRSRPMLCPEIHGSSGLDGPQGGPQLPRSCRSTLPGKAVNVMAHRIQQQWEALGGKQHVRLVCTGALTNAALLITLYPEVMGMIEIVIMGGAMGIGNTGPVQEFNIQTDPEAAFVVFNSGVPLVMVPLEVTHTVLVTPEVLKQVISGPHGRTPFRESIRKLLLFFKETYHQVFSFDDPPLHDPCAVAYVITPELFKVKHLRVDIETKSDLAAGQTIVDTWRQSGRPDNCIVATAIDVEAFWKLQLAALERADAVSPINTTQHMVHAPDADQ